MDFQRIFILLGLAVTAYLIILAWNEDYGSGRKVAAEQPEGTEFIAGNVDDLSDISGALPLIQESSNLDNVADFCLLSNQNLGFKHQQLKQKP